MSFNRLFSLVSTACIYLLTTSSGVYAEGSQQTDVFHDLDIPHEAYKATEQYNPAIQVVTKKPPEKIAEAVASGCGDEVVWIGGYWGWDDKKQDYVWIGGIWRRPPPGHTWIEGFWGEYDKGWAWARGFWSTLPEDSLDYVKVVPKEPKKRTESPPPGWVFVPEQYIWREKGYVKVPSYWDWELENRRCPYNYQAQLPFVHTVSPGLSDPDLIGPYNYYPNVNFQGYDPLSSPVYYQYPYTDYPTYPIYPTHSEKGGRHGGHRGGSGHKHGGGGHGDRGRR